MVSIDNKYKVLHGLFQRTLFLDPLSDSKPHPMPRWWWRGLIVSTHQGNILILSQICWSFLFSVWRMLTGMYQIIIQSLLLSRLLYSLAGCPGSNHYWAPCCHSYPLPTEGYHCCWAVLAREIRWHCWKGSWSHPLYTMYDLHIAVCFCCHVIETCKGTEILPPSQAIYET